MNFNLSLTRLKILIIDDQALNVMLLEQILREQGYNRLHSVSDSRTAMAAIAEFEPDLVLLDLMMPHVDGFSILESVRANEENQTFLPILVLTADASEETKLRALSAGATDFLQKPFDKTEVVLRIRNLLQSRNAHVLLDNQRAALEEAIRERTTELHETIERTQRAEVGAPGAD
jgi:PleD family two-component response regulator